MISIKQNVDDMGKLERMWQQTLDCYVDSLADVALYGVEACPPLVNKFKPRLLTIHKAARRTRINSGECQPALDAVRVGLKRELQEYASEATAHYEQETAAMKDIVALLAGTADSIEQRGGSCIEHVDTISRDLERASQLEDLSSIRRTLSQQVAHLWHWAEQMRKENATALSTLQEEISAVRSKLKKTEQAAFTDALTGLSNRHAAERHMTTCMEKGTGFCLLLLDLDEFKSINDRFGHAAGDEVLRVFGAILIEQVRPSDLVSRWGGDEFLVVLNCDLPEALTRSQQIAVKLAGRYPVDVDGREVKVMIKGSAGVAEHRKGESIEDIFLRVDRSLYASKPKNTRSSQ